VASVANSRPGSRAPLREPHRPSSQRIPWPARVPILPLDQPISPRPTEELGTPPGFDTH
jgi:hypothetical protein